MSANLDIRPSPSPANGTCGDPSACQTTWTATSVKQGCQSSMVKWWQSSPSRRSYLLRPVAGYAFATLRGLKPDLVAVAHPCIIRIMKLYSPLRMPPATKPLGILTVDGEAVSQLDELPGEEPGL
jgi:hypothetical protein